MPSTAKLITATLMAFIVGIGFTEGVFSFIEKNSTFANNGQTQETFADTVTTTMPVMLETGTTSNMGSDDNSLVVSIDEYQLSGEAKNIDAKSFLIGDIETGEIIASKNLGTVYPIASVSKLVTALVSNDALSGIDEVTVTKSAIEVYGTSGGLRQGEKVKAKDLLYPLLLESSNDVAELISEQVPSGVFAKMMNSKVSDIGMMNTSFEEASGLSANNVSTVDDLFKLAQYIYKEEPQLLDITRIKEFALLRHTWTNHNYMLKYDNFIGGKNGYTDEALRTTVSLFDLPITKGKDKESRSIVIILLQSNTREADVDKLLDFVKKSVSLRN